MKLMKSAIVVTLAAATATAMWAQAPATKKPAATTHKAAAHKAAPKKAAHPAAKPKTQAKKRAPFGGPAMAARKPMHHPAAVPPPAQAVAKAPGLRDPFISPVVARMGGPGTGCATGKRCLVIDEINLKGIAKTPHGWVAMVENPAQKAYFLYVNDPIFDGYVEKITNDSVIFRQNVTDNLGHQTTREVVKRVVAPAI